MSENFNKSEILLQLVKKTEDKESRAKLRVFFGMSAGVGKTYAMLKAAHQAKHEGKDIVIGIVETHNRIETTELMQGLESIPRKKIFYRDVELEEFDLDATLSRRPEIIIVDELAHTNVPGSRHNKRYQDILELLDAGIDVYTAVNVQHIESRKEMIEKVTNIIVQETVPDSILDRADLIELIDISPTELLKRLKEGKVYLGHKAEDAQKHFFREAPLNALREIALRLIAERVDRDIQELTQIGELQGPINVNDRLMVAVSHSPYSEKLIRSARRIAFNLEAPWIAVNINTGVQLSEEDEKRLRDNIELARRLGAKILTIVDDDIPRALTQIAKQNNVTQLIIGRPAKSKLRDILDGGTLLEKLIREAGEIDIHIIHNEQIKQNNSKPPKIKRFNSPLSHYLYCFTLVSIISILSLFITKLVGYEVIGFIFLLTVLLISLSFNFGPTIFTALISSIFWNTFFIAHDKSHNIVKTEEIMMCIAYFLVAVITGILTNRIRKQKNILRERGEKTQILYEVLRCFTSQPELDKALSMVLTQLERSFNGNFFILKGEENSLDTYNVIGLKSLIDDRELSVAKWVFEKQQMAGWSTDTLPSSKGLYIPLKTAQSCLGILSYIPQDSKTNLSNDHLDFFDTVSREIAFGLERDLLQKKTLKQLP